jgi:hypothetical protein
MDSIEDKYLNELGGNLRDVSISGYKQTHPKICQSCGYSTKGNRGFGQLECTLQDINIEVDNYGTCPKWKKVYG